MDVVRLRKMTERSVIHGGKHDGETIQELLDNNKRSYLAWMYYCQSNISFMDNILDYLHIYDRIEKPGTDKELLEKWNRRYFHIAKTMSRSRDDRAVFKYASIRKKNKKKRLRDYEIATATTKGERAWSQQHFRQF